MRPKVIDTVLGPVTLRHPWYHCGRCRHGLAPRDAELGVTGMSTSPGLAAMDDLAAAAGPFAGAVRPDRGARRQFTVIGDDAAWIWGIASEKFPEATQIVDLYHAREHAHSLTRSVGFMLGDRRDTWLAKRLEDLDYGDIDAIITLRAGEASRHWNEICNPDGT